MGGTDAGVPDGSDRTLFGDRPGKYHSVVHIYTGTLCQIFTDPDFLIILWRSIVIAVKTTVICLLLGYPIAYYIARSEQKKQNALILVITIPMWINMLVRTYAWIGLLSDGGLIQRILTMVGLGKGITSLYRKGSAFGNGI